MGKGLALGEGTANKWVLAAALVARLTVTKEARVNYKTVRKAYSQMTIALCV